jgi:Fic family protein
LLTFEPNRCYNRLMKYNWQQSDWPEFRYDLHSVDDALFAFAEETGHINGMLKAMPDDMQMEAIINTMVAEAIKTSEIEGEYLSRKDVMSSIRNNLGVDIKAAAIKDKKAQGAGKLMVDVRNSYQEPLTKAKLFEWHEMLMADSKNISIGKWRKHSEPMQVVSGALGQEKVHFEAPPSLQVPKEMDAFIKWFNDTAPGGKKEIKKAAIRAAITHLYFETIHPFEDGNGRIGRAIAEKALSQTLERPVLLSLSRTIEADKKSYYSALEEGQRSNEITKWVEYFVNAVLAAQRQAKQLIDFTLKKTKFFDRFKDMLNERQLKVVKRMMDEGPEGFEGGMSANKYISITKASKATATRDLQHLTEIGALIQQGGGRSTRYILNL